MPKKFLVLGGGRGVGFLEGGVEVPILFFMGVGIFPNFVLIKFCSVDCLVACLRISTGF